MNGEKEKRYSQEGWGTEGWREREPMGVGRRQREREPMGVGGGAQRERGNEGGEPATDGEKEKARRDEGEGAREKERGNGVWG